MQAKSLFDRGMKDEIAIFNLYFRSAPENNNWALVSGVEEVLNAVNHLGDTPEGFFEKILPGDDYKNFREYLKNIKFTGNVYAMKEGEIAFANQPIITIEAPIIQAQLLETPLLNIMNHQMRVATKTSRITRASSKIVYEFGSRQSNGPLASTFGSKATYIGGCKYISNVVIAAKYGIESRGSMAHSYINAFGFGINNEYEAFDNYIKSHKGEDILLLIDTYDTLKCGVKNAIKAFKNNGIDDSYSNIYGVRLDSGDLSYLSNKCRQELDMAELWKCKIAVTNSLDENLISDLERQNAIIDIYGVGDSVMAMKGTLPFGNIYKLVQFDGKPVMKISDNKEKLTNPGFQITYRIIKHRFFQGDVTCLKGDHMSQDIKSSKKIILRQESDRTRRTTFEAGSYTYRQLQKQMIKDGEIIWNIPNIKDRRDYYFSNLKCLNKTQTRLLNPHYYKVNISDSLYNQKIQMVELLYSEIANYESK